MKNRAERNETIKYICKILLLIISFGLVFGITYYAISGYLESVSKVKRILVAQKDLYPGDMIDPASVSYEERPEYGLKDYSEDLEEVMGKYVKELGIHQGDPVHPGDLTEDPLWNLDTFGKILNQVKNGERINIGVKTDLARSGAGELGPGSLVDVYLYYPEQSTYMEDKPSLIYGPEDNPELSRILVAEVVTGSGTKPVEDPQIPSENLPSVVLLSLPKEKKTLIKEILRANEEGAVYLCLSGEKNFD